MTAPARADLTGKAFTAVILQVAIIDIVFSINSIITAIGMAQHVPVMIAAVIIAMGVMWLSSGPVGGFIHRHPTTKMLALAFLMLIGVSLVADGVGMHIPRGYIYFAMAFAAVVETINVLGQAAPGETGAAARRERVITPSPGDRHFEGRREADTRLIEPVKAEALPHRFGHRRESDERAALLEPSHEGIEHGCAGRIRRRARSQSRGWKRGDARRAGPACSQPWRWRRRRTAR